MHICITNAAFLAVIQESVALSCLLLIWGELLRWSVNRLHYSSHILSICAL